jgi:8-amino-3,8-dideoxy-alpha-D-manno-octulosonate transaminase
MPGYELIGKEERKEINDIFDKKDSFYEVNGKRVKKFEHEFNKYVGSKYAVTLSSGTAAIKTALIASGVKKGDEVITQAFTFIATVGAIIDIGAIPIIVNIDETLNMCPIEFKKKITKKTKAVIPVHMLGVSTEVDKIIKIAKKNKIIVIDDNCEALGAFWGRQKLGAQADVCTWSFDYGKTITTGEGGMITTNNKKIYKLSREYKDHGHENNPKLPRGKDTRKIPGFNFRTTELNAALGLAQLKKINNIVKNNKRNYDIIYKSIKNLSKITFRKIPKKCYPLHDCLIFRVNSRKIAKDFVKLMSKNKLNTKNLPDAVEWHFAKHWSHIFKKFNINKKKLSKMLVPSSELLEKSIAIPISSIKNDKATKKAANKIYQIAKKLKLN